MVTRRRGGSDVRVAGDPIRVHALIDGLAAGGAEFLLSEFAAVAPAVGLELTVGYLHDRASNAVARRRLERLGIVPTLVPVNKLLSAADLRRVRRHLCAVAPQLLHTHLYTADFLGGLGARTLGLPSVCTLHGTEWGGPRRDRVRAQLVGRGRRYFADRVIAVSAAARSRYLEQGWDRPERVVAILNGISGNARPGAGNSVREHLGLGGDDLVVGMLSTLRPEKGHEVAAEAVGRLRERHPQLRLLIVGDGPLREEVARLIAPLGDAAIMTGHREDVMAALDAVDVLVHPSHHEAFPTALLEAMAAGVPAVATRVGGIPEIVEDGVTGLLIDPPPTGGRLAAALERVLADPFLRGRLGSAGRERFAREFTAEAWGRRTRGLYEEVLAERGRRSRT